MKKSENDQMRQEYDFLPAFAANTYRGSPREQTLWCWTADMAKVFPTSKAVNDALRVLAEAGRRHGKAGSNRGI